MAGGGTKLPRSNPCSNSSHRQAASPTSVLRPGRILVVAGVDQQQLEPAVLQHIPARLPVLAGRLHHHLGDALLGEPVGKGLKIGAEGLEGAHLLAAAARAIRHANTGHDLVLADVQPGAVFVDHLHRRHLPCRWVVPGRADRSGDAERRARSNSSWCRDGPRVSLINGLSRTKESRAWPGRPDSHPSWRPPAMAVLSAILSA